MDAKRGLVLARMTMAVCVLTLVLPQTARATKEEFPHPLRMWWTPSFGWARVAATPPDHVYPHFVDEAFEWTDRPGLYRVDCPRTDCTWGTYEHELRFVPNSQGGLYCDTIYPTRNRVIYLPQDYYRDSIGSQGGEFSWGVQAWRLVLDELYQIHFECLFSTGARDEGEFNLTAQVGHCHLIRPCSDFNTYGDESARLVPTVMGQAPTTVDWLPPFANNYSLESSPNDTSNDFKTTHATATRVCSSGAAQGSCYWRVEPTSTSRRATLRFDHFVDDFLYPRLGTASVYHEFYVRCPIANSGDCRLRLAMKGFDAAGNETRLWVLPWQTVPDDGVWRVLWMRNVNDSEVGFPPGTTRWRFYVQGYADGTYFHADYNYQFYHLPS